MTARQILHQLIDELPPEDLPTAERILYALTATSAPHVPLDAAPLDAEPDDDDFDGGLSEARAEAEAGHVLSQGDASQNPHRPAGSPAG